MREYFAFTKKEFCEALRTYKLFIMAAVFLLFGMMNPLVAKLTPLLLENYMPEGIKITITEPTALDSFAQFFKNIPQMGLFVLVIVFSQMMSQEYTKGTLVNMITKGLSRKTVIFAKYTMAASIWTMSFILCYGVTYLYTIYFWDLDGLHHISFSVFCLWFFGMLLLSIELLGGVIFRSSYGGLLFTGGFAILQFLLNIIPKLKEINPISLASNNMRLLTNELLISDFRWPIIISSVLLLLSLYMSVLIIDKKEF